MSDKNDTFKIIVKTHAGLEHVLAQELIELGCPEPEILVRAVSFQGNEALLYKVNYSCRTALKVLKVVKVFSFSENNDFYKQIKSIKWENYLSADGTLAVEAIQNHSIFNNTQYIARFTKDAISDRFREKYNKRPSVDLNTPDLIINIYIYESNCTVSLDSSGMSLHKRGYRKVNVEAPLNEVTAAGIIRLSGWSPQVNLFDPMCGSGTITLEAAMHAMNMPGCYFRNHLALMNWQTYDKALFLKVKSDADKLIKNTDARICGADIARHNVSKATENVRFAKLNNTITIKQSDFFATPPHFTKAFIITNPPYGERLKPTDVLDFYKNMGNTLKRNYAGYTAWLFTQHNENLKHIGLRPSRKITLFNGKIECKLLKFDLYEGKKKHHN